MPFRIATFNVENLRIPDPEEERVPSLETRLGTLRPQLRRLEADVLCLQEVFSQEAPSGERSFEVLERLFEGTPYADYSIRSTETTRGEPYLKRNLVVVSRPEVRSVQQHRYDKIRAPRYRMTTAEGAPDAEPVEAGRPFLHAELEVGGRPLHLINVHLKSRSPTDIPRQQDEEKDWKWLSAAGWAEGFFLSSMKRVSQALEVRVLVDELFDEEEDPRIVVAGDFNAPPGEVPVEAIVGRVRNTGNPDLVERVLVPCGDSVPEPSRYTYLYHGEKRLLDHMLISRPLMGNYQGAQIHNEDLQDESVRFAFDTRFPAPDHAPFVGQFDFSG